MFVEIHMSLLALDEHARARQPVRTSPVFLLGLGDVKVKGLK